MHRVKYDYKLEKLDKIDNIIKQSLVMANIHSKTVKYSIKEA